MKVPSVPKVESSAPDHGVETVPNGDCPGVPSSSHGDFDGLAGRPVPRRSQGVTITAAGLCMASLLSGCALIHAQDPQLTLPPGTGGGIDTVSTVGRPTWIFGASMVCLDRPGAVMVTGVTPADGDLDITGFAVRPNPALEGKDLGPVWNETLADAGMTPGPQRVDSACDEREGSAYEVVVQAQDAGRTTWSSGFLVHSKSGDSTDEVLVPHGIVLCYMKKLPNDGCPGVPEILR